MSEEKVIHSSDLTIKVGLNESRIPVRIEWKSDDHPENKGWKESKGLLLSFFDKKTLDTFKIDLWTTEMQVMEMDRFFFHTLKAMTDTYLRATNNQELVMDMRKIVEEFGFKTGILKKS